MWQSKQMSLIEETLVYLKDQGHLVKLLNRKKAARLCSREFDNSSQASMAEILHRLWNILRVNYSVHPAKIWAQFYIKMASTQKPLPCQDEKQLAETLGCTPMSLEKG